jgi:hypothetical protein
MTSFDEWEDIPDEFDAYITVDRGRYHVSLEGTRVGDYPSQDVAEIELASAMVTGGVFPNAWFINDHGNWLDINAHIRRWHNDAGDAMAAIEGVQYQPGDRVRTTDMDWPHIVVGDWGPAGVEIHTGCSTLKWPHCSPLIWPQPGGVVGGRRLPAASGGRGGQAGVVTARTAGAVGRRVAVGPWSDDTS